AILWNPSIRKFYGIEVPYMANRPKINKIVWGFGVRPDTLDPTIINIFMPFYKDGLWYVLLYTLNSDTWRVLGIARLPCIDIRIKRSWRVAVAEIPTQLRTDLPVPLYISKLGNSLVISGNDIDNDANWYICAWFLEVEAAVVTSWRVLFVMPSQNIAKLIGFTHQDYPVVEVDMGHETVHTLQVYDRPSQQFHTLEIIEERVRQLISSPGASSTPTISPGTSSTLIFSQTPYMPPSYYGGSSSNTELSNCKHLLGRIKVLQATLEMYMHPEQYTPDSTALIHDLNNDMEKLVLSLIDYNFNNETDPWEFGLDIDDFDLQLTPSLRSSKSTHDESSTLIQNPVTIIHGSASVVQLSTNTRAEPYPSTPNPVRIIPGPAGIVQQAKLLREKVFILDSDGALMSSQKYMQKIIEDVGEDDDFNSGAWVSATNCVMAFGGIVTGCLGDIDKFLKRGKLDQIVAILKSCSSNMLGDLNVTIKDISGTIPGTIHHKVIGEDGYGNDITVGAAMILKNVFVFTPKPSEHYLNIIMRNMVEVFRKDTVLGSGTG
nr:hypothetical protein [Tanacetum cinerariifolium]